MATPAHTETFDVTGGVEPIADFDKMDLPPSLLRGIYTFGWDAPSLIQQHSIAAFRSGRDLIAQARSGTGKTGAFTIGSLSRVDFSDPSPHPQVLILSPVRELAGQTHDVVTALGKYLPPEGSAKVVSALAIGGSSLHEDKIKFERGVYICVGCPGRVYDLMRRNILRREKIRVLVLDEADEMLSQGFQQQIHDIFKCLNRDAQVCLFSATMPPAVLELTNNFMREPVRILVNKEALPLAAIKHFFVKLRADEDKLAVLMDLYKSVSIAQGMVFANTRSKVDNITRAMNEKGFTVASIHAEMPREERERVIGTFRDCTARVLVSTDLLSRGLDVQLVSIVINYELPRNADSTEVYLHRVGRCGRYGRKGIAINFLLDSEEAELQRIAAHYDFKLEELPKDFAKYIE